MTAARPLQLSAGQPASPALPAEPLPQSFYAGDTRLVARSLLGRVLVHDAPEGIAAGIIVETEAYGPEDPASHAYKGTTPRNRPMFGPPGRAYVYRSYGIHWCVNAVTGREGTGEAVLIRALEPLAGIPLMQQRRGITDLRNLCRGPGRLCQALAITGEQNSADLTRPPLFIAGDRASDREIACSPRIGISFAVERPWRFYLSGNPYVSR